MAPARSAGTLDDLLERRRKVCATFESQPSETTADAFSAPVQHAGVTVKHEEEACHHRDLQELQRLLAERRGRCHVLESSPLPRQADAIWNEAQTEGAESQNLESLPAKHIADFRYEASTPILLSTGQVSKSRSKCRPSASTPSPAEQCEASTNAIREKDEKALGVIREVEEHLTYLKFEEDHLVTILCMLLRYHDPETVQQLQMCCSDGISLTYLCDLSLPPSPLAFFLGRLDLSNIDSKESSAMKTASCVEHLCALLLAMLKPEKSETSQLEVLSFFLLLAAVRSAWRFHSRGKRTAEAAIVTPVPLAQQLWEEAAAMLAATPRSLWSLCHSATFPSGLGDLVGLVGTPICQVAADEVLQHIYERPSMDWRLVVLDARSSSRQPDLSLPVCLRVSQDLMGSDLMEALPRDDQIHLCIVGDDLNHAQMLAEHLVTKKKMCHISLVEGGWEALEHLVSALGLELLPPSPQKESRKKGDRSEGPREEADDPQVELASPVTWMASMARMASLTPWVSSTSKTGSQEELLDL